MPPETVLTIIGMGGVFLVSLSTFVWWISTKFFGLEKSILAFITNLHNQNLERFHQIENRIVVLEHKRNHGV